MQRLRALLGRPIGVRLGLAGVVASAVLAPLAVHWLRGRTLAWFDTVALYAPQRWLVEEALRAFRLPLWNPYSGGGQPLLADAIHGALHPVSVAAAWLDTGQSMDLLVGGYVLCAGLGAALLARELGASRTGAVLAGAVYGTSGYVLSMAGNLPFLAGAGSMPFALAGLRAFAVRPGPGSLALAAGATAALALSGDAQALMVAGAVGFALAWEGAGWRGAVRAVAGGSVGLLVASVQLVPSAVHLPRTVRAEGLWESSPAVWAFEPWRLPELLLPGFAAGEDPYFDPVFSALADPAGLRAASHPFPFATSVFVGTIPLLLALAGAREGRRGRVLGLVALGLLWIALGPRLGASTVLGDVPIWRAFRYSEKLVGPLTLALCVLAGLGLDAVVERRAKPGPLLLGAVVLGLAAIGTAHALAAGAAPDAAPIAAARATRGAWHVGAALLALAAWVAVRDRITAPAAGGTVALLAWIGTAAASPAALRPGDPSLRLRPPSPTLEAAPPGPRVVPPPTVAMRPAVPGGDRMGEVARDFAASALPAYNVRARIDALEAYPGMAAPRLGLLRDFFQQRWPLVARRLGATHLLLDPALSVAQPAVHAAVTRGGSRVDAPPCAEEVWAVPHRAWASFPERVRVAGDLRAAAAEMGASLADPADTVVVEAASSFGAAPGRVLGFERGRDRLRVEAEAEADATLVIADAWWPGWRATLDGQDAPVFPADVLLRAVRWPAGRHVLEMRYDPPEVRSGLRASALGLVVAVAWMLRLRRALRTGAPASPSARPRP